MYNLLIVDDEWIIRDGLTQTIPWNDWGIQVSGTAKNGREAIEFLKDTPIDIVLTDIRMPKLSGLDLIEQIKLNSKNKEMKIIILTGHNEFDYAKQAIRLKADEYLLKPTDPDELEWVMKETVQKIKDAEEEINDVLSLQILKYIQHPTESLYEKLINMQQLHPNYRFIKIQLNVDGNAGTYETEIKNALKEKQSILIEQHESSLKILMFHQKLGVNWKEIIIDLTNALQTCTMIESIHISELFKQIEHLPEGFRQTDIAGDFQFEHNGIKVFEYHSSDRNLKLDEMIYYIKNHYQEPLSQSEIAEQLFMSNSRFSKLFKQYVGTTFSDYVLKIRMEAAQKLLKNTSLKIFEIAEEIGYGESRYFSQLFKENTGTTPLEYREKMKS